MTLLWTVALLAATAAPPTPASKGWVDTKAAEAKGRAAFTTTAHFVIESQPGRDADSEVKAVATRAEAAWTAFAKVLGPARMGKERLTIRLGGPGSLEEHRVSSVDPATGALVLYRMQGPEGVYEGSLAHELVHALRFKRWTRAELQTDAGLFVEEAFAELLAQEAGFPSAFPRYGAPAQVVAGAWLVTPDGKLPTEALVRHHRALNFRCMAQAYGVRIGFATYLTERFKLPAVVKLAYDERPLTADDFGRVLGVPLPTLAQGFVGWVKQGLAAPGSQEAVQRYKTGTPIRYFPVCGPEVFSPDA